MPWFVSNKFGDQAVLKEYRNPAWLYTHITIFCRVVGPLVMVGMWALAIAAFTGFYPVSGIYLLFLAVLLIFQEFGWLFNKFSFLKNDNCVGMCWRGFVWFEDWKRAFEYFILAVIGFVIGGFSSWPLFVGGGLILVLSIFYWLKAIRFTKIELLKLPETNAGGFTGNTPAPTAPAMEWGTPGSKY
ncbi:hypothetical protein BV898_13814 [Hypsibius exemplaris]|uniref:Uncharacterized protein n=1 Tax=Hypsibius exemplaris TaxID=2072580 RepID=A0A1W0W9U5_HYPEX|nr:hypothetical protein BV898_13814 [Hypsibius exemplaris]